MVKVIQVRETMMVSDGEDSGEGDNIEVVEMFVVMVTKVVKMLVIMKVVMVMG